MGKSEVARTPLVIGGGQLSATGIFDVNSRLLQPSFFMRANRAPVAPRPLL